ncbi:hypothetical protein EUV02_03855 [Polymorphobacter arshaanensis]|uniref:Uncharacterized protein n=1 Tax=Glacieibacterium arshaanense TaxID=2511025 RepID=A0A4Y9ER88_9SPHN|nr:hypothetical protein [Polymorphobacter arshaanensis]TFU06157.1 hypothetical protein EUV02_03855 [Polymorphobacter arshaanensis]
MSTEVRGGIKSVAWMAGRILLVTIGWLTLMAAYFSVSGLLQQAATPPYMSAKIFGANMWDRGYFYTEGSFNNDSAISDGDQLPPQTIRIVCVQLEMVCTLATAEVSDNFLSLDMTRYDITTWDDKQITVVDTTPLCVTQTMIIDRAAETFTMIVRRKSNLPDVSASGAPNRCSNIIDKNISIVDGMDVYERLRARFDQKYGLYLHAALFLMNALYFGAIWLWWRRRRAAQGAFKSNI